MRSEKGVQNWENRAGQCPLGFRCTSLLVTVRRGLLYLLVRGVEVVASFGLGGVCSDTRYDAGYVACIVVLQNAAFGRRMPGIFVHGKGIRGNIVIQVLPHQLFLLPYHLSAPNSPKRS